MYWVLPFLRTVSLFVFLITVRVSVITALFIFFLRSHGFVYSSPIWSVINSSICWAGLVNMNSFSLFITQHGKFFSPPSNDDSFDGQNCPGWPLWCFRTQSTMFSAHLAFRISIKSQLLCWWSFLYMWLLTLLWQFQYLFFI